MDPGKRNVGKIHIREMGQISRGKIQKQTTVTAEKRPKQQRKIRNERIRNSKSQLGVIRNIWKNRKIQIPTEEIREGKQRGDTRIVWGD